VDPLSRLAERLWWFTTGGDPGPLLEDAAVDESQEVLEAALRAGPDGQAEVLDREAVAFAALVHWFRYTALPKGQCEGDYLRSISLARAIGFDDPGQITVGMKVGGVERNRCRSNAVSTASPYASAACTQPR
jgi:hypothetical protein